VKDSRWLKYFIFPFTRYSTRRTVNYLSESEFRLATAACKMTMYSDGITAESDKAANRYDAIYHSGKIMVTAKWVQTPQQHYQLKMSNRNRTGVSGGNMWPKKFSFIASVTDLLGLTCNIYTHSRNRESTPGIALDCGLSGVREIQVQIA